MEQINIEGLNKIFGNKKEVETLNKKMAWKDYPKNRLLYKINSIKTASSLECRAKSATRKTIKKSLDRWQRAETDYQYVKDAMRCYYPHGRNDLSVLEAMEENLLKAKLEYDKAYDTSDTQKEITRAKEKLDAVRASYLIIRNISERY